MNKTKKTIKGQQKSKKGKQININPKVWIAISISLIVVLIGGVLFDQLYKRVVLTIEGDKYYMDDLNYYFYSIESRYAYYDQLFGGSYWDMSYDPEAGTTVRDLAKDEAVQFSLYNEVMYREALSKGYSLTEEENTTVSENVTSLLEQIPKNIAQQNGFSKKYLTSILSKTTLVDRYRLDLIAAAGIDEDAIKAGIDFEENRQYDIEYLFISTAIQDEQDDTDPTSDEVKTAAFDKINAIYEEAKSSEDWSALIPEEEKELIYRTNEFVKGNGSFPEDFETIVTAMDNNEVSNIFETEEGYYIVRMLNNASTTAYDRAVESAITSAENEAFDKIYKDLLDTYDYSINQKALDELRMGEITL